MVPLPASTLAIPLPPPLQISITHLSLSKRLSSTFPSPEVDIVRVRPLFKTVFLLFFFYRTIHQSFFPRILEPFSAQNAPPVYTLPWYSEDYVPSAAVATEVIDSRAFQALQNEVVSQRTLLEATLRQLDEERRAKATLEARLEAL